MLKKLVFSLAAAAALATAPLAAQANTVALWNFNSTLADGTTGSGSTLPALGSGSASVLGVTSTFASGSASGGSSDPVGSVDNSGWQTTGYAAQGAGDKTRGVQFLVSTMGFENITLSYDLRHSNTSARHEAVQYTLDGNTWTDAAIFVGASGDTWFNGRAVDLSGVSGASNNSSFGVRVLATFAPGTSAYAASSTSSSSIYSTAGTWRFDMVTVSGTVTAIPEPETYALMLVGLAALGMLSRRRA